MESFQSLRVLIASFVFVNGYFSGVCCINCPEVNCPDNLPYCSPVGCVFECPNGSFTEDKQCKTDCGDEYMLDDQCVEVCPHTAPFVETDVITIGHQFMKLHYCRTGCPPGTYDFQYTCVRSCPNSHKFVDGGMCKPSCVPDKYRLNITIDGHLTAIKCVSSCPFESRRFILDGYCVTECNSDEVVYKGNCQKNCPPESKIWDTNEDGVTVCKSECDAWQRPYVQNGICVAKCMTDLDYVQNVCSVKCPDNLRLKYIDDTGNIHCKDKCNAAYPGNLLEGDYCVSRCKSDHMVYDTGCVKQCPENSPVHVTDKDQWGIQHVYCMLNCDVGGHRYAYNNTCVENCPQNANYVFNGTCLKGCPNEAPYHCTDDDDWRCSNSRIRLNFQDYRINLCQSECPFSLKAYHYECKAECPSETYSLQDSCVDNCTGSVPYISLNTCVSQCPVDTYPKEGRCTNSKLNCTSKRPYRNKDGHCVSKCYPYEVIDDNTCINSTQCQKKMVFHGYCTELCPVEYVYLKDNHDLPSCKAKRDIILGIMCYVFYGVGVIVAMMLFLSMKQFDLCKLPTCTDKEEEDDVAPLLIEEHETAELDIA